MRREQKKAGHGDTEMKIILTLTKAVNYAQALQLATCIDKEDYGDITECIEVVKE